MHKTLSTVYQYIAPAHRAIWRLEIFLWLSIIFWYADHPSERTFFGPLEYAVLILGLSIYHIVSEYRRPKPSDLSLSDPKLAGYSFAGVALLGMALSILVYGPRHIQSDWLWFTFALTTTYAAYLVRPRPQS